MRVKRRFSHERRLLFLVLSSGLPAVVLALVFLFETAWDARSKWIAASALISVWLFTAFAAREHVANSLRTLANLLEAMREGDYSIRGRVTPPQDSLTEAMEQVNAMAATLRQQRLGALEATALLRKVMEEIEIAVFAFDPQHVLRLVNRAGERVLAQPSERLLARDAESLGLADYLAGDAEQRLARTFPGAATGRWVVKRSQFREDGRPHHLLVLTDLTRPLREEELQAWQRLVRVLGHELNNSLAPIQSIARSLETILKRDPLPEDWMDDASRGLNIIASRSESLGRFMSAYARLAKLPPPRFAPVEINALLYRVVALEHRMRVFYEETPQVTVEGDADQLEQALINLVNNAVEAAAATQGRVFVKHERTSASLTIIVRDEGPGLSNTANLFVPFFTTKRGGSGIGLVLCRQIAEAHGGTLSLQNVSEGPGCEALLTLPI